MKNLNPTMPKSIGTDPIVLVAMLGVFTAIAVFIVMRKSKK